MTGHRFDIYFYNDAARKEYLKLDGSIKTLVELGYRKLMDRADEIGKRLGGKLAGCKELKYRKNGIRIIFRIVDDGSVEIVDIVVTGKREDGEAFRLAERRLAQRPERTDIM